MAVHLKIAPGLSAKSYRRPARLAGERPAFLRHLPTDWIEGGWDLAQSVQLAKL